MRSPRSRAAFWPRRGAASGCGERRAAPRRGCVVDAGRDPEGNAAGPPAWVGSFGVAGKARRRGALIEKTAAALVAAENGVSFAAPLSAPPAAPFREQFLMHAENQSFSVRTRCVKEVNNSQRKSFAKITQRSSLHAAISFFGGLSRSTRFLKTRHEVR
jgi:hypothetical protein